MKNCNICLENKLEFKRFNCIHECCLTCYDNLIKFNFSTCPICRETFRDKIIENNNGNMIYLDNIIYRKRRKNITYEQKLFNKNQSKKRMIQSRIKKNGRLDKYNYSSLDLNNNVA
tara:strand:- start:3344 stop:3691 length:348 start_codon:yes stop_codon:yes gene_type:complete